MAMPSLTALLRSPRPQSKVPAALKTDGGIRYATCSYDWRGNGFNASQSIKGVVTVTFPTAPAEALPDQEAIVIINEQGRSIPIRLKQPAAGAASWAVLFLSALNGTGSPSTLQVAPSDTRGYAATAVANVVTITGILGRKFTLSGSGFVNPLVTAVVTGASCSGIIPYGRALVVDQAAGEAASATNRKVPSSIAVEPSSYLTLPSAANAATSLFVGISTSDQVGGFDYDADCCGNDTAPKAGYECGECVHYLLATPGNTQQIKVTLEQPSAGDTIPVGSWIGVPVSYRETTTATQTEVGTLSIGATGTERKLARNVATSTQLVVRAIVNKAAREVWVGVAI